MISQKNQGGSEGYYLHNAHGDVNKLVDSSGTIFNGYSYDAFGNTISYAEQVENRFRYTGEQYDTVSGLIYLRARYYDPSIGRFTQEDPYRGDGLNLYTYVSNNPVKYIDPTGLAKCAAAKNYDKALDSLQMILDIGGFVPGIGDVLNAVNLGISIFRGNVLDSVFSAIAIAPGLGSAISTPLKAIFNAVGNASEITKSVGVLGILFGGTNKIVSSLDGVSKSLKAFAKKIPTLISSLKNNYVLKTLIGKKQLDKIVSGVRSGINSLVSRTNQVFNTVKKAIKKNAKEEAAKTKLRLKYNLQFFAENGAKNSNLSEIIKVMKSGQVKGKNIISKIDNKTQVIFRRDIGTDAHPIRSNGYDLPVDHYNIEVQTKSAAGKWKSKWSYHIIMDSLGNIIDVFE